MKHALTACLLACLVSGCASNAPEKLRQQGYELLAAGRIDEAGAVLEHPGLEHDVVARLLRAEAAFRAGDHDAAIARYRTLVAGELSHAMRTLALHNLAASLSASGRSDEAYRTLQQLADHAGPSPSLEKQLGVAALADGRLTTARSHFARLPEPERTRVAEVLGADFVAQNADTQ